MKHALQVDLLDRALRLVESHKADMSECTSSAPLEHYTSSAHLEREREMLFHRFPLIVGFSSQVSTPGDFFTNDITDIPLLVTRDERGDLHAFINVCRHRGAKLVTEPCGGGRQNFTCPYHGWCYEPTGKLLGTPYPAGFPQLDKAAHGLVEVPVAEHYGLVFALLRQGEAFDIDGYLGPLLRDLKTFGLDDYVLADSRVHHRRMNWKLQVDAALETYHFGYLHATTSGGYFNNIAVCDWAEPHARIVVPKRSIVKLRDVDPADWKILDHASILYSLFPNSALFLAAGNAHLLFTFPESRNTSVIYGGMLVRRGSANEQVRKFYHDHYWKVQEEDMMIAESVQAALCSGVNAELLFGRHEYLVGKFHNAIDKALDGRLTPSNVLVA